MKQRKNYEKPTISQLGTLATLTQGGGEGASDFFGPSDSDVSAPVGIPNPYKQHLEQEK